MTESLKNVALEEEESFLPHSNTQKTQSLLRHRRVFAFFTVLNVGALVLIYALLRSKTSTLAFPNPFPSIEYEIRSFKEEYNRDTSVADVWDTKKDYPPFEGLIFIDNAEEYRLPPGVQVDGKANQYGTAWTHQYHCLEMIHTAYETTIHNSTSTHALHGDMDKEPKEKGIHHIRHCFDYLRQHIICSMDMRVEYPTTNPKGINGYEIPRRCVKRESLDKYMGEHGQRKSLIKRSR